MRKKEALHEADRMYYWVPPVGSLTRDEKIRLGTHLGYMRRALKHGRIRIMGAREGDYWGPERMKESAQEIREYVTELIGKAQPDDKPRFRELGRHSRRLYDALK